MKQMKQKDNLIFGSVWLLSVIVLVIRARYTFSWSDETFYLTIAHRFATGSRMFVDEWYTSQISTPVLMPFYYLFRIIAGGTQGIYLYFRLLYIGLSAIVAFYVYLTLRAKCGCSAIAASICSMSYLWYSRANIWGMSYYNLTLTFVLLGVLLLYGEKTKSRLIMVGVCFALAIINNPYMAVLYVVVVIVYLVVQLVVKKEDNNDSRKLLWWVILGTIVTGIIYLTSVFSQVSISELLVNIPHILNEPELQNTNPLLALPLMFVRVAWRFKWTIVIWTVCAGYCIWDWIKKTKGELSQKQLKKPEQIKQSVNWKIVIRVANLLIFLVNVCLSRNLIGCVYIAGTLYVILELLCNDKWKDSKKYCKNAIPMLIAGISTSIAYTFASDTGLDAMSIGFVMIFIAMVMMLDSECQIEHKSEHVENTKEKKVGFCRKLIVSIVVIETIALRIGSVYRDVPVYRADAKITSGPAAGLYTSKEHVSQYEDVEDVMSKYVRKDDTVFISQWSFWPYLCVENKSVAPNSWRMRMDSPRLEEYYSLYPEKIPTFVLVLKPEYGNYESDLIQDDELVLMPNENSTDGFLYDYMETHDYETIETECGNIYRSSSPFY